MKKRKRNGLGKFDELRGHLTINSLQQREKHFKKRKETATSGSQTRARKENQKIPKVLKSPPNKYYPHSTKATKTRVI